MFMEYDSTNNSEYERLSQSKIIWEDNNKQKLIHVYENMIKTKKSVEDSSPLY